MDRSGDRTELRSSGRVAVIHSFPHTPIHRQSRHYNNNALIQNDSIYL